MTRVRTKPNRNSAATTPNNATKAGSSMACDIAAANGACKNSGSWAAAPSPRGAASAPPGISADSRDAMNAAMPALPSTDPTCRVVL